MKRVWQPAFFISLRRSGSRATSARTWVVHLNRKTLSDHGFEKIARVFRIGREIVVVEENDVFPIVVASEFADDVLRGSEPVTTTEHPRYRAKGAIERTAARGLDGDDPVTAGKAFGRSLPQGEVRVGNLVEIGRWRRRRIMALDSVRDVREARDDRKNRFSVPKRR